MIFNITHKYHYHTTICLYITLWGFIFLSSLFCYFLGVIFQLDLIAVKWVVLFWQVMLGILHLTHFKFHLITDQEGKDHSWTSHPMKASFVQCRNSSNFCQADFMHCLRTFFCHARGTPVIRYQVVNFLYAHHKISLLKRARDTKHVHFANGQAQLAFNFLFCIIN